MSYISEYYNEIKELTNTKTIIDACRDVKAKYNLSNSVDGMRHAYKSYHEKVEFENEFIITKQTTNKEGEIVSETRAKPQEKDSIDTSKFEPVSFTTNPFGEGKWIRYDKILTYSPEELKFELDQRKPINYTISKTSNTSNTGVFMLGDFHLGAYVGDLLKTPDFNFNVICEMLQQVAYEINECKYKEVHLFCVGDFIESFSGLNHINSWKGLSKGAYGMKAVILAHEILSEHLFSKITNLEYVGFVSGNHDRVSSNKAEDDEGQVAMMMEYLFKKDFKVKSEWSPLLLSKMIDGIGYVVTHGHLGISNKEISKVLFDYGFQGVYNVFAKAHKHSRETKKTFKKSLIKYDDIEYVTLDSSDYRAVTIAPLFTGNFFSEGLGYTSTAGLSHFVNNGKGKVKYVDYCI